MIRPLLGRVAVVTGAGQGLGLALCEQLALRGAKVVLSSRNATETAAATQKLTEAGYEVHGVACDVSEREQVDELGAQAVARFGRIDIWINNAGASAPYGPTRDVSESAFMNATSTIMRGTYFGSMTALRHLPRPQGVLVNLVGRGERTPVPLQNAYASAKAWVRNFTLALSKEERSSGVCVIAFQPGLMDTRLVLSPEVLPGYEQDMRALAVVLRLWGAPPTVAAEKLIAAIINRKRGRVSAHPWWWMFVGPLRILAGTRPVVSVRPERKGS